MFARKHKYSRVTVPLLQRALGSGTVPVVMKQTAAIPSFLADKIVHIFGVDKKSSAWEVHFVTEDGREGALEIPSNQKAIPAYFATTTI